MSWTLSICVFGLFCFLVLCCSLYWEVGWSVSQPVPRGVRALHVGPSLATVPQRWGRLAASWHCCHQPGSGPAPSQPGAALGPHSPTRQADGGRSEHAGRAGFLERVRAAGGEPHPGGIPVGDPTPHGVCKWCAQCGQRSFAASPHAPSVRPVGESILGIGRTARSCTQAADRAKKIYHCKSLTDCFKQDQEKVAFQCGTH